MPSIWHACTLSLLRFYTFPQRHAYRYPVAYIGVQQAPRLARVGTCVRGPQTYRNEITYGLFRNGFRSCDRRQFSERSGRNFFDNCTMPNIQSRGPENLSALMSIEVGFHSVNGAWGFVSAEVNSMCNFQGFR